MAIYFFQAGDGGPIKIGHTCDVPLRLKTAQCFHHEEVRMLASGIGCRKIEKALHRRFDSQRIRGEWFHPSPEIVQAAAAVAAGTQPFVLVPDGAGSLDCKVMRCCLNGETFD